MALRLTFGGRPGPNEWGCISEPLCDLTNALLNDTNWDPTSLYSPDSALLPPPSPLPDDTPFGIGRKLIVEIETNGKGFTDVYIDDIIGLTIDDPSTDNTLRLERAALLAIHAAARPPSKNEPIPREAMAALNKLQAEGGLEEVKTVLGWEFNFRRLIVSLPLEKFTAWHTDASEMLRRKKTTLDTNIGRWVHISMVIPQVNHFTSRLRSLLHRTRRNRFINITSPCLRDIETMLEFITAAKAGIEMNILAYLEPSKIYRSDSCPHGIGGYNSSGVAWRWKIPKHLLFRASNNMLEHLACIVGPWLDMLCNDLPCGSCILSMTDSTTSEGWSNKSNFRDDGEPDEQVDARITLARHDAHILLQHSIKRYSQWFTGAENVVADALSRDTHLSDSELTNRLFTANPEQMPSNPSPAQRNHLVRNLSAADSARKEAVTGKTSAEQDRAWRRWCQWCESSGISDVFLDSFSKAQRITLIGGFARAVREGRFSGATYLELAPSTVVGTVSNVAQAFRDHGRPNPTQDADGKLGRTLSRQFRAYRNTSASPTQQKAIPLDVIAKLYTDASSNEKATAIAVLATAAFYFACRSCEYSQVSGESGSKIVTIGDIQFVKDGKFMSHDKDHLSTTEIVSVTFRFQKNDRRNETISQYASTHETLCPVKAFASIVHRIQSYSSSTDSTPINTYEHKQCPSNISSTDIFHSLRVTVTNMGPEQLGFEVKDTDTHSIRSGAAMAMYLSKVPVYVIMKMGRWSNEAFLLYIRTQVDQFSHNISDRMVVARSHQHIPSANAQTCSTQNTTLNNTSPGQPSARQINGLQYDDDRLNQMGVQKFRRN